MDRPAEVWEGRGDALRQLGDGAGRIPTTMSALPCGAGQQTHSLLRSGYSASLGQVAT